VASIDNVFDAMRTAIPTYSGFSTKKEIGNPYSLKDNPNISLSDSWGIAILSGSRSSKDEPVIDYSVTTERGIKVILCREVFNINGLGLETNEASKNLLLDAKAIRNNFLSLDKFGVLETGEEIVYLGDSGINLLNGEDGKFIFTEIDFTFEIIENIN